MVTPSLKQAGLNAVNQAEQNEATEKHVEKTVKKTFAGLLRTLTKKAEIVVTKRAGPVQPATPAQLEDEIPELSKGLWDTDEDGSPIGWINVRGIQATVTIDVDGRFGCKGAIYVTRPEIVMTQALAARILADFGGHNRDVTAPAVKRYRDSMNLPAANRNAWHYVGNTIGFVVSKPGDKRTVGQCNMGHTCTAFVGSTLKQALCIGYFGIPEQYANLADVNIPRTGKDTIGRKHRYDKYADAARAAEPVDSVEEDEFIGVQIKSSDIKTMNDCHSQALRIIACVLAGKKVKDSEPLGPGAIAELDDIYGDVLEACVVRTYILDRRSKHPNKSGTAIPGALKLRMSLSHAAAMMVIWACEKNDDGTLALNEDAFLAVYEFLLQIVDENYDDEDLPAVALRNCLETFKMNKMTDQNVRWLALKVAIAGASGDDVACDYDTLCGINSNDVIYLQTFLDPVPTEPTGAKELTDDEGDDEV